MKKSPNQTLVTVFGGAGFLGRHVVRCLAERGYRVRVACRRPDLAGHLQPLGNVGQIQRVQANLRHQWSIDRAAEDSDVIINLAAILSESGKQSFEAVHVRGAAWIASAAAKAGANLVHVSSIGADPDAESKYSQTKGRSEAEVRKAVPEAIIMRPSIMFGPEDDFFNRFASMARFSPAIPLVGGGKTKFQPVYVGDVAEAIALAVDGQASSGTTYELGGLDVMTFRECMQAMLEAINRKRLMATVPFPIASMMASILQFLPGAPLTPDQVTSLKSDNVVSNECQTEGRTLEGLGITAKSLNAILPTYMVRFRKQGQFEVIQR